MKRKNTELLGEETSNKRSNHDGLLVNTTRIPIKRPPKYPLNVAQKDMPMVGQKDLTGKETVLDLLTLLQGSLQQNGIYEKGPVAPFQRPVAPFQRPVAPFQDVLEDLYPQTRPAASFPEKCSICKCRFKLHMELTAHLDEHFRQNNNGCSTWKEAQKMETALSKQRFRGWEPTASQWLSSQILSRPPGIDGKKNVPKEEKEVQRLVIDQWSQKEFDIAFCWICHEPMQPKHSTGFIDGVLQDEWYYENATHLSPTLSPTLFPTDDGQKKLVHSSCKNLKASS
jgi:hypothetical protein